MSDIEKYRNKIDEIDEKMAELFQERMEAVKGIAAYKKAGSLPVSDPLREESVINRHLAEVREPWKKYYRDFMQNTFSISRSFQNEVIGYREPLLKNGVSYSLFTDNAFIASQKARADLKDNPETINATIGTLYGTDGVIMAFKSVYDVYDSIPARRKAGYSSLISGNPDYTDAVFSWINRLDNIRLAHRCIATPGGTGAIVLPIFNCLNPGETLIIPEIAWGSYKVMAAQNGLSTETYEMFEDGQIAISGIMKKCREIMDRQKKVVIVINDPCQNPTGISLGKENWHKLIGYLNELSREGSIVIINDIAYLDYARDWHNATDYMEEINAITSDMAVIVAFSCSKSLTAYGMRLGAGIILTKEEEKAEHLYNSFIRSARAFWSNVNNGFMDCFTVLMNEHRQQYLSEKQEAIQQLLERCDLFIKQANECSLPVYPYREGFFVTVKVDEDKLERYNEKLIENHIYGVMFNKGIRVALCGLNLETTDGLAGRMKNILDSVQ